MLAQWLRASLAHTKANKELKSLPGCNLIIHREYNFASTCYERIQWWGDIPKSIEQPLSQWAITEAAVLPGQDNSTRHCPVGRTRSLRDALRHSSLLPSSKYYTLEVWQWCAISPLRYSLLPGQAILKLLWEAIFDTWMTVPWCRFVKGENSHLKTGQHLASQPTLPLQHTIHILCRVST